MLLSKAEIEGLVKSITTGGKPFQRLLISFLAWSVFVLFQGEANRIHHRSFINYHFYQLDFSWLLHDDVVLIVMTSVVAVFVFNLIRSQGQLSSEYFLHFYQGSVVAFLYSFVLWGILGLNFITARKSREVICVVKEIKTVQDNDHDYVEYYVGVGSEIKRYRVSEGDAFSVQEGGSVLVSLSEGCFGWEVITDLSLSQTTTEH